MALRWSAGRPSRGTRHWCRMVGNGTRGETVRGNRLSAAGAALGQGDADPLERFDHLVGGLGAEVLDLQQIFIAEAHQVGDRIDLGTLEAVVGPHREVELLEGDLGLGGGLGFQAGLLGHGEGGQGLEQADQLIGRLGHGIVGGDAAVGLDLEAQPLAGRAAFADGGFVDGVVDPADGHEHGIDLEQVDGGGVFVVAIHGPVADAPLHVHLHLEAVAFGHGGDRPVAVDHLHLGGELQIGGGHPGRAIDHQTTDLEIAAAAVDRDRLAVEQDVENVLADAGHRGVLVVHARDDARP